MDRYEGFERWLPAVERSDPRQAARVNDRVAGHWFHALYESPVLYSGLLDERGRVIEANRLAVEGCGFERDEVLDAPFWECGWWSPDPDLSQQIRHWFETAVETGQSLRAVSRYFVADGRVGMVELDMVPIIDTEVDNGAIHYVVVTGLDISDLLATHAVREDRMADEVEASRRAEQRFRNALDAMIDNVYIARAVRDDDGNVVDFVLDYAKQRTVDFAGRSVDDLVGGRVSELYPSWEKSGMRDRFVTVVETGEPFVGERLPYQDVLPDGTTVERFWDVQVAKLDDGYIAASRDVTELIRNEEAVREATAIAQRERFVMDALQQAALPMELPSVANAKIGVHYQPALRDIGVGGDWYDVFTLPDGTLQLIIADVAGHGLDAAAYMVQLRNVLRTLAVEEDVPSAVLSRANRVALALHGRDTPLTTCCTATLAPSSGMFRWSVAGHPPPLLRSHDGTARFIEIPGGPPLGVIPDPRYDTNCETLHAGDRLVLYTDGLIERRDQTLDYGMQLLLDGVHASAELDAGEAAEWLARTITPGIDDLALIVLDVLADV